MSQLKFGQLILEKGQLVLPFFLLENIQNLNISPEELGYITLGLARLQASQDKKDLAQDPWLKWCLSRGWAKWETKDEEKTISFSPLWVRLYDYWEKTYESERKEVSSKRNIDFQYGRILKWLDEVRGTLSITLKEKQTLQEFNLKYGWSTDFILIFLQLIFEKGFNTIHMYKPIAKKVYESGVTTVDELIVFMDELDWVHHKVAEVKKSVGQYGGVTNPQREMYLKWNNEFKYNHQIIMRAAMETVRTNNPSFKYIDGILKDWHEKGVKTIEEAEQVLRQRDAKTKNEKKTVNKNSRKKMVDTRDWEKMLGID